ncbi:RNA polymerase, sigma-24 subunit, ECF subfamily [Mucilaginibacter paludis DSM 18603]|uniref:RNA polymerase, sigma-24 subunit, ECF subfamily n=2 Tax=Mucilaginibacter TaxID=423349 RepID=H1YC24_9SPHI|nr:RNA polymerase, sigma-24 subunit, ECF subfamily [Mucilaginibacter paludis DSM 18603]
MSRAIQNLPDKVLLAKHRNGERGAFDILFKRYYQSLFNYAYKILGNFEIAEELTMDVLLRLWQKQNEIILEGDIQPYLKRSVKNAIFNHHRKKILDTITIDEFIPQIIQAPGAADDTLKHDDLQKLYLKKLSELSPQRQKVFRMSREENMTYAQIAKKLDLSVNTVENYMVASLNFFRKHLKEYADHIVILIIALLFP